MQQFLHQTYCNQSEQFQILMATFVSALYNMKLRISLKVTSYNKLFFALSGAQGVTSSVRPFVCVAQSSFLLHLSGLETVSQDHTLAQSILHKRDRA